MERARTEQELKEAAKVLAVSLVLVPHAEYLAENCDVCRELGSEYSRVSRTDSQRYWRLRVATIRTADYMASLASDEDVLESLESILEAVPALKDLKASMSTAEPPLNIPFRNRTFRLKTLETLRRRLGVFEACRSDEEEKPDETFLFQKALNNSSTFSRRLLDEWLGTVSENSSSSGESEPELY